MGALAQRFDRFSHSMSGFQLRMIGDATAHGCFKIAISRSSTSVNFPLVICPAR